MPRASPLSSGRTAKGLTPEQRAHADFLQKIKPYVRAWYRTWHQTMVDQPFYRVNSRT